MSEEEKFESVIQEIKDIYVYLTQGEPSPDDEITAREKLIKLIQNLKTVNSFNAESNMDLFEDALNQLDNWDTLELWFIESELPEYIQKIINITDEVPEFQAEEEYKELPTTQLREDLEKASLDIDEIVGKVSEQFKGEIDDLKSEIDVLKLELEKKDEVLKQVSQKKVIKKITPKKDVKLPPPKIKIPVIKKPEQPPIIIAPSETETQKSEVEIGANSIEHVKSEIKEELEKLKTTPVSILDILEESEKSSQVPEQKKFTEIPEKPKKSTLISEIIEIEESEEDKEIPFAIKEPKILDKSEFVEEPKIVEKPELIEKSESIQKPKIKSVSIEEVEAEEVRSSGTDLFNVFSSVGDKTSDKLPTLDQTFNEMEVKEKKKRDEKKKKEEKEEKKKSDTIPFIEFSSAEPELGSYDEVEISTVEELPSDKDALYQELIALEGKRYSLEKSFKEIEKRYNTGSIDDYEHQTQSDALRAKLEGITSRINKVRRVISSL
jgi:hypothetical protein